MATKHGVEMPTDTAMPQHNYEMQNLVQLLDLFEALLNQKTERTLTRLAEQLSLSKNKVFRMLVTLVGRGIIKKGQRGEYSFDFTAFETARRILSRESIDVHAQPVMRELAEATSEAVYLATVSNGTALLVDMIDCCQPVKAASFIGSLIRIDGLKPGASPHGRIREMVVIERGGLDEEITSVSAVIMNQWQEAAGALVIIAPTFRTPDERIDAELVGPLVNAAMRISKGSGDARVSPAEQRSTRCQPDFRANSIIAGGQSHRAMGSFLGLQY